jgi:hypothetical protein
MAIEFNCPYCSAMIRVPDSAGGGKGKCPRCARRITVPKMSSKAPPKPPEDGLDLFAPPGFDDGEPSGFGDAAPPTRPSDADADGIVFAAAEPEQDLVSAAPADLFAPSVPVDLFAPAPRALGQLPVEPIRQPLRPGSIASKLKRKKSGGSWLIPVGFGLVLCGALGWFLWQQYQVERLAGELTAESASGLELPPEEISQSFFKQSPGEMKELLADLEKSPVPISSELMRVQFGANKKAVTVRLSSGPQTQFYRVRVADDPGLINFRKKHTLSLEEAREEEVMRSATEFADEYQRVTAKKSDKSALNPFRNSLALPSLVRGLGHHVEAVYGRTAYPCVYEQEGWLYFLLPPGAAGFEITGRKHNGRVLFPGKYQVKVTGEMKLPAYEKGNPADKNSGQPDSKEAPGLSEMTDEDDKKMKKKK